jgi:hypothetical protein
MSDNSFEIQVINDSVGQALGQLLAQAHNLRPALLDFAEWAKAETDQRFADQADWHGQPWAPNAELTLANYLRNHGGSKNFKKDGKLSAAGTRRLAAKRILQVDGTLRRAAFSYDATSDSLRFGPGVMAWMPMPPSRTLVARRAVDSKSPFPCASTCRSISMAPWPILQKPSCWTCWLPISSKPDFPHKPPLAHA